MTIMDSSTFETRLSAIESRLESDERRYRAKNMSEIWRPLFGTPFDRLMTELASLYGEADESQRQTIHRRMERFRSWLDDAWYFVCRVTARVRTVEDAHWVRVALSAALLQGGERADFRDLICALIHLRYVAEQRGLNAQALFDEVLPLSKDPLHAMLLNVRNHSEPNVQETVTSWGMPPLDHAFFRDELAEENLSVWRKVWRLVTGRG